MAFKRKIFKGSCFLIIGIIPLLGGITMLFSLPKQNETEVGVIMTLVLLYGGGVMGKKGLENLFPMQKYTEIIRTKIDLLQSTPTARIIKGVLLIILGLIFAFPPFIVLYFAITEHDFIGKAELLFLSLSIFAILFMYKGIRMIVRGEIPIDELEQKIDSTVKSAQKKPIPDISKIDTMTVGLLSTTHQEGDDLILQTAKKDFKHIWKSMLENNFVESSNFTKNLNDDLKNTIASDIKHAIETVLIIHEIKGVSIKKSGKFLGSMGATNVVIKANVDYYWLYNGEETSIPGELETTSVIKNKDYSFMLSYGQKDSAMTLKKYSDDNAFELGH